MSEHEPTPSDGAARSRLGRRHGEPPPGALTDLRSLKYLGVFLPILFLVGVESFRFFAIEEDSLHRAENVALAVVIGMAVVVFALVMFYLIERAQRQVIRQNRELAAVNAVSTAVQGELGVEQIIDSALQTMAAATGATDASVTVFAREGVKEPGIERALSRGGHEAFGSSIDGIPHLIDVPLSAGTTVLGRLRLHLPPQAREPDLLASATLQNIGHQLACAIQIGQLVADLQRRKNEGHGLYDILLRISSQGPLVETLTAVARHACDLANADEAEIRLSGSTTAELGLVPPQPDGIYPVRAHEAADGIEVDAGPAALFVDRRTVRIANTVELPLGRPDAQFGDLWVARRSGPAFTGRDRGFIQTLAELASIAIASARMRESEQQAAIIAERERIAREMHDSLAQVLGVTHLRLIALQAKTAAMTPAGADAATLAAHAGVAPAQAAAIRSELDELAELTEEAYRDVREAILGLREGARVDRSLTDGLRAFLEKYSHQSGIPTTLESTLDDEPLLSPRAEVQVIRVIQEALTNVRKHSGASTAVVRISNGDDWTTFTIEDDGRGFDLGGTLLDRDSGFGLHTMRERMELAGGTLDIDSSRGRGTRVIARLPAVPMAAGSDRAADGRGVPQPA